MLKVMEAVEFLNFAKKLDHSIEADARSCVSRSYYCAYHEAKEFVEQELNVEVDQVKGGTHERLSKILSEDKNARIKAIGYRMVTFHGRRVMADYFLNKECNADTANEAILECEKILKAIDALTQKKGA